MTEHERDPVDVRAEDLYEEFRRRTRDGENLDFDAFCAEHPKFEMGLRAVRDLVESGDADAPSASRLSWSCLEPSEPTLPPGTVVGRYSLREVLGTGGFGVVYLADQSAPIERPVALKILHADHASAGVLARFDTERQALAAMRHPNIAAIFDAGATESGHPYFAMELVAGPAITRYAIDGGLRVDDRLRLFLDVCAAVRHAHGRWILHRDLKPSNVLVESDADKGPIVKVIDFGLAKAMGAESIDEAGRTRVGTVVGTPAYMSPEQLRGGPLDARSDVYSLGILLYELLADSLPYDAAKLRGSFVDVERYLSGFELPRPSRHVSSTVRERIAAPTGEASSPPATAKKLAGELDWIVLKAIEKEAGRRYDSVDALAQDIERFLRHEPIRARSASWVYRARKFARRRPTLCAASGVALILASVFATFHWTGRSARYNELSTKFDEAVQVRAIEDARAYAKSLESEFPGNSRAAAISLRLRDLERELRLDESTRLRGEAEALALRDRSRTERLDELTARWTELRQTTPKFAPAWERSEEISVWTERRELEGAPELELFSESVRLLHRALNVAPKESRERARVQSLLEELYWGRYEEAEREGGVRMPASFFRGMIDAYGTGKYSRAEGADVSITLGSDPPGAEVYLFRLEELETRLVPLAYDLSARKSGKPYLEIERLLDTERSPFRPGDRWRRVRGVDVRTRSELAVVLEAVADTESVSVEISRAGGTTTVEWTPFLGELRLGPHSIPAGRYVSAARQFGFTFKAFPLELGLANRIGRTSDSPLEISVPPGRYLALLRRSGYLDARIPIIVPGARPDARVRLVSERAAPVGFVHVSGGEFVAGRDREAEQPLEYGVRSVSDFLLARHEVSLDEWLEFLNHPSVFDRTDERGAAAPKDPRVIERLERLANVDRVQLVYVASRGPVLTRQAEARRWTLKGRARGDWPAFGISQLAALEYIHWRNGIESREGRYRLPTDSEWEKAAGVDGRAFVAGDYRLWSHSVAKDGALGGGPSSVGLCPYDESVYGVRDLGGSVVEWTSDTTVPGELYVSYRGGGWTRGDEQYFRVGSRNGLYPQNAYIDSGFRLVFDLSPPEGE